MPDFAKIQCEKVGKKFGTFYTFLRLQGALIMINNKKLKRYRTALLPTSNVSGYEL